MTENTSMEQNEKKGKVAAKCGLKTEYSSCFYWCFASAENLSTKNETMLCISKFQYVKVNGHLSYMQVILKNELKTNIFIAQTEINLFVLLPYLHLVDLMNESVSTIL